MEVAEANYEQYVRTTTSSGDIDDVELREMAADDEINDDDEEEDEDDYDDDEEEEEEEGSFSYVDEDVDEDEDDDVWELVDAAATAAATTAATATAANRDGEKLTFSSDDEDGYADAVEEVDDDDNHDDDEALVEGMGAVVCTGTPDEEDVPVAASSSAASTSIATTVSATAVSATATLNNHHDNDNDNHNTTTTTLSTQSLPSTRPPIIAFAPPLPLPSRYVIEGLKITGDPNVPAGQLSFFVEVSDTNASSDFRTSLTIDERPLISFDITGVNEVMMTDRINNIRSAYRGKGQINRLPGVWLSEWVDLTLMYYHNTTLYGAFSILWDDEGQDYRHVMDFKPFQCKHVVPSLDYETPPPTTTTTTTATTTTTTASPNRG